MTAVLYDGDNFTGASLNRTANDSTLVDDSWNDLASSIQVFVGSGGPSCGNGSCETGEDCSSCSSDCGSCCGNGACGTGEDCSSCSADCGSCGGTCTYTNWAAGTNYNPGDVVLFTDNNYYVCENANPGYDPTVSTWFWDPTTCTGGGGEVCGNGTCGSGEDCNNCTTDCGTCGATCGANGCESGEDCNSCSQDCGACPTCSDGVQNQGESGVDCGGPCAACGGGGNCTGVSAWNSGQGWWEYNSGDMRTHSGKKWQCHTPGWCYIEPGSGSSSYGWNDQGSCN
jgi:hypothetical protein